MTNVSKLIQQLTDNKKYASAAEALKNLGAAAVEPLIAALRDPQPNLRTQAARLLGTIGDTRAITPLMELSKDPALPVQIAAFESLAAFKSDYDSDARIPEFFRQIIMSPGDAEKRRWAALTIERVQDKSATDSMWLNLLSDSDPLIVAQAALRLNQLKPAGAFEPLVAALQGWTTGISPFGSVIQSLAQTKDPRAFEIIIPYLKSSDPQQRYVTINALHWLGDPRAIPFLEAMTEDKAFAYQEDHGGPSYSISQVARQTITAIQKK